jgi:phenylacetate-coenzyme A ligase PaaK-like adenylate-forming protein
VTAFSGGAQVIPHAELLARQRADVADAYLVSSRRLRWPAERLAVERERRLRDLLALAAARSPFWRERLAGRDLDRFSEADLPDLPVLTKTELMSEFDNAVTEPGLTLARVEEHLDGLVDDAYLDDRYRVLATSGSSGARGVVVYGWNDWVEFAALNIRWEGRAGEDPGESLGTLFAANATHVSGALHAFFTRDDGPPVIHLPSSLPLPEIVAGLEAAQPTALQGYPSMVALLAREAQAGRLHLRLQRVATCGEQLTPETRAAVRAAWGVEISNAWGCTEGAFAFPCGLGEGLHLPDDLVIIEPIDAGGRPVRPGEPGDAILLTNLYNRTQPLIRYRMDDAMTVSDELCACGCAHRRITALRGKVDGYFTYPDGAIVHRIGMESVLLGRPGVLGIQVTQTPSGVMVFIVDDGHADVDAISGAFHDLLRRSGVTDPDVTVQRAESLDRLWSGKVRQFQPLP